MHPGNRCFIAFLFLTVVLSTPASAAPAVSSRVVVTGEVTVWPASLDSWDYESAFLGTARGSQGQLAHEGGWDLRGALDLGSCLAARPALDLELCYGRDDFTLSEMLEPVHVGTARRYDLGDLKRQRLALRIGTWFDLRRGTPRLVVSAHLGLIDLQFNEFQANQADLELPLAVGGAVEVSADDVVLFLTPLDVSLRCDLGTHLFMLVGGRFDRLEAPLDWSIAGAPQPAPVRDRIAVDAAVLQLGAGIRW